ncbi:hypothetical protein ONE63_009463 [Megalurothrips usitatus]|uniref:Laminin EGF-like domain-containing protein n=1 Tax=Megalurothrips usitatus TaxID=439358 RepID=A0AAV7XNT3_9NEOP|nr:hypothetical protein ONE63_009463 [Megalurothrips usitatus]
MPDDAAGGNDVVEDYVCTACPAGHAGKHCDRCAEGHFGDPTVPGERCRPCECAGGPCDPQTGRCLSCPRNTDGWRCEKCKAGHYGDPATGCEPCACSPVGALTPDSCDPDDGQCSCKPRFAGRTCERCEDGFGNVTAGCVACACSARGSRTASAAACDAVTGECTCRPGYAPPGCHACLAHHYNDPDTGCAGTCPRGDRGGACRLGNRDARNFAFWRAGLPTEDQRTLSGAVRRERRQPNARLRGLGGCARAGDEARGLRGTHS